MRSARASASTQVDGTFSISPAPVASSKGPGRGLEVATAVPQKVLKATAIRLSVALLRRRTVLPLDLDDDVALRTSRRSLAMVVDPSLLAAIHAAHG